MHSPISVQDKKTFIQWFLNHYHMQKRESVWILNYICNHHDILAHVHFVRNIKDCPRGIIITSECYADENDVPFRFHKNHVVTCDPERSFHDIRLNRHEELYIQLNFYNSHQCALYVAVLEENPYHTEHNLHHKKRDKENANQLLDQLLLNYKRASLKKEIDQSLDQLDEVTFKKLSNELLKIEQESNTH